MYKRCVSIVLYSEQEGHHFVLFYVEVFRFTEFFSTLLRVGLSSLVTIIFILISQFLFGKTFVKR